jgi:hypothetical protein
MKLAHAIRVGEALAKGALAPEDKIAVLVLVRFARRVLAARESVKALAGAVMGDEDLNQDDLFGPGGGS